MSSPGFEDGFLSWMVDEVEELTPHVEAAKVGTAHEGHDGWQMSRTLPGTAQCSCGGSLDQAIAIYVARGGINE